jgi:hypothetical protein
VMVDVPAVVAIAHLLPVGGRRTTLYLYARD